MKKLVITLAAISVSLFNVSCVTTKGDCSSCSKTTASSCSKTDAGSCSKDSSACCEKP